MNRIKNRTDKKRINVGIGGKRRIKNPFLRFLTVFASTVLCLCLVGAAAFYTVIVLGASQTLQESWICTAMHTYTHQYLATWFFSEEKIAQVLEANSVDDSGHDSNSPVFQQVSPDEAPKGEESTLSVDMSRLYEAEGYRELSEGVWLKDVSGVSGYSSWVGYVMLIEDPLRIRIVDTPAQFDHGWTVMQMVESVGGVAGINGGGFNDGPNYDSNGGSPAGILIEDGQLVSPSYSDRGIYNLIGFDGIGNFILKHTTVGDAMSMGIKNAVSFSPYIVVNGEGMIKNGTGGWGISPRTGIGQRASGEVLFVVIDGRQAGYSIGSDLDGLQSIMLAEGCINGAMMDGGSSTAMVHGGEYINRPSLGHERWINNSWVVMPVGHGSESEEAVESSPTDN